MCSMATEPLAVELSTAHDERESLLVSDHTSSQWYVLCHFHGNEYLVDYMYAYMHSVHTGFRKH